MGVVVAGILPVLLQRFTNDGSEPAVERAFDEASRLARLLGLDASVFFARAMKEFPDPQAWIAEERALAAAERSAA